MCERTRASSCVVNIHIYTMATVAIMVGGAVLNAATFIGGNYLAKYLSGDSGQAALDEKKRHDLALEKYQRDYAQYQKDRTQLLDWVAEQDREKNKAFHDAPRGTGKGWPPSNNWLPLPRYLKMWQNAGLPNKRCGKSTSPGLTTSLGP